MTSPSKEDIFMSRKDVMSYLRIKSRKTIDAWMDKNNFPQPTKLGRVLRWKMSEVVDWTTNRSKWHDKQEESHE